MLLLRERPRACLLVVFHPGVFCCVISFDVGHESLAAFGTCVTDCTFTRRSPITAGGHVAAAASLFFTVAAPRHLVGQQSTPGSTVIVGSHLSACTIFAPTPGLALVVSAAPHLPGVPRARWSSFFVYACFRDGGPAGGAPAQSPKRRTRLA